MALAMCVVFRTIFRRRASQVLGNHKGVVLVSTAASHDQTSHVTFHPLLETVGCTIKALDRCSWISKDGRASWEVSTIRHRPRGYPFRVVTSRSTDTRRLVLLSLRGANINEHIKMCPLSPNLQHEYAHLFAGCVSRDRSVKYEVESGKWAKKTTSHKGAPSPVFFPWCCGEAAVVRLAGAGSLRTSFCGYVNRRGRPKCMGGKSDACA